VVEPVLATLRRSGEITVGDNQPYNLDPQIDYTVPFHALRRSLPHLQVEFRQDEIETATTQSQWAIRFAQALP
jgi:predicted N-formylglutamate amidohydrolase